jgi:hypothetical protein
VAPNKWGRAMRVDESFHAAYRDLEGRMKALAEADGDVFLPNPERKGPSITFSYVWSRPWAGGLVLQKRQSRKLMRDSEPFSSRWRTSSFTFAFDAIFVSLLSDTTLWISPKERCSLGVLASQGSARTAATRGVSARRGRNSCPRQQPIVGQ